MNSKRKFEPSSSSNCYNKAGSKCRILRLGKELEKSGQICKRAEIIRDGKKFPNFQKPSVIGVFSVDEDRKYIPDERQLKYLYWQKPSKESTVKESSKVNFNLNEGIENSIHKNELLNEKLNHIFSWIKCDGYKIASDFVCFRGLLTTIMCTPYEQQEGWIICATRRKSTIFLCAFDTEKRKKEKQTITENQKRFQSWGYKFEQFMLTEEPGQKPDTSKPVVETEEFACVFRTRLNSNSIVYVAEMDGICSDEPVDSTTLKTGNVPFIELKTCRHIETQRQDTNFKRYKLLKWWCQSFLVGIESIYCGFRDDNGIVSAVKIFSVRDLPKMAKGLWDPCVCMNFCAQFLEFVKSCITESTKLNALWKFEWTPGNSITGKEIMNEEDCEYAFVPKWYQPA